MSNIDNKEHNQRDDSNEKVKEFLEKKENIHPSAGKNAAEAVLQAEKWNTSGNVEKARILWRKSAFERKYNLKLFFEWKDISKILRNMPINIATLHINQIDKFFDQADTELSKYPSSMIRKTQMKQIILTEWWQERHTSKANKNWIESSWWFYTDWTSRIVVWLFQDNFHLEVLHHELFHLLDQEHDKNGSDWDNKARRNLWTSVARQYWKTNANEDQATIVDSLFIRTVNFTKKARNDESLRKKIQIITWCQLNNEGTRFESTLWVSYYTQFWFTWLAYYPKWSNWAMGIEYRNNILNNSPSHQPGLNEWQINENKWWATPWWGEIKNPETTINDEKEEKNGLNVLHFSDQIPRNLITWNISLVLWTQYYSLDDIKNDSSLKQKVLGAITNKLQWKTIQSLQSRYGKAYDFVVQLILYFDWYKNTVWEIDATIGSNTRKAISQYQEKYWLVKDQKFGNKCFQNFIKVMR